MNKNNRDINLLSLPKELLVLAENAPVYESSGKSGAKTFYIDKDSGFYLKIDAPGTLSNAAKMQVFLAKHGLAAEMILYLSADRDYLLIKSLNGEDGSSEKHTAEPERLSVIFGQALRLLHNVNMSGCSAKNYMKELIQLSETTVFRQDRLDGISDYIGSVRACEALNEINTLKSKLVSDVILHGDYCLPNIMLNNWELEGFIDLSDSGIGDRHYDIAMGLWTLNKNLKSQKYGRFFLDAYGTDYIDKDRLRICGLLSAVE